MLPRSWDNAGLGDCIVLDTLDSLLCPCPLILDIDTELHLESVTISPYTLPGAGPGLPRTTKGREVMVKDSVRDPRGGHCG